MFRIGGTGGWSSKGCEVLNRNNSHISCQCNHMTSFAVLMDISKREVFAKKKNGAPCELPIHAFCFLTSHLTAPFPSTATFSP